MKHEAKHGYTYIPEVSLSAASWNKQTAVSSMSWHHQTFGEFHVF